MDDSNIRQATLKQYQAGLKMLAQTLELCPEDLWFSSQYRNRFWHIAYHAMFYTHLYLQRSESDFHPWAKHVPNANYLGPRPWAKDEPFQIPKPYTKAELDQYLKLCRSEVGKQVPPLRFEDPSGFSWLAFNKLELQFYNIRHLQHHTGQLIERLRNAKDVSVRWVISV